MSRCETNPAADGWMDGFILKVTIITVVVLHYGHRGTEPPLPIIHIIDIFTVQVLHVEEIKICTFYRQSMYKSTMSIRSLLYHSCD